MVRITGTGMHPFGRFPDRSLAEIGAGAAEQALAEAGITPGDRGAIGAAYVGTAYGGVATGHRVLGQLAMTSMPIVDVEAGCASGAAALALGAAAVRSGEHERVLVLGVEKMPAGMIRSSFFEPWQEAAGFNAAPAAFALRAQRLLRERSLTKAHLAAVVVKNRAAGVANDDAMFRSAVEAEQVLASRVVCEPLHLWMLCSPNEGAAAVVLERGGQAQGSQGRVAVRAVALRSHLPGSVLAESSPLAGIDDAGIPTATQLAAGAAFEAAGVEPTDVELAEVQDTDAARELMAWEELGLCKPGEQAAALAAGGPCPVNTSGGLLSKGEPLGASALGQVVWLARRLRDGDARLALAHVVGRGANAAVTILARE